MALLWHRFQSRWDLGLKPNLPFLNVHGYRIDTPTRMGETFRLEPLLRQ
ncbi:MAG: hypothetical protein HKM93_11240 [Desulfobacteraceae bacterium]|nr:hypothetical protein [Desulfobacteraceae bacterium]